MTGSIIEFAHVCVNRLPKIHKGKRKRTLTRMGLLLLEMLELSGRALEEILLTANRDKCVPLLPCEDVEQIARSAYEEAAQNVCRWLSGVVFLYNIPTDELEMAKKAIEALPYGNYCCLLEADAKLLRWQKKFAKMQAEIIGYEIDEICNDAVSAPDVDTPVVEMCEANWVTTMNHAGGEPPMIAFQNEGDTSSFLQHQIAEILPNLEKLLASTQANRFGCKTDSVVVSIDTN